MWPSCGNLLLDILVWFWAASITIETTCVTCEKYYSKTDFPVKPVLLDISIQTIFLALFLGVRIVGLWNFGTCQILTAKAILSVGLLYYYYRLLFIYLPISPTLGPLMIRLRYMVIDDFLKFLQLFMIFMISSGVAITAVLYPHHPFNLNLFSNAIIFRGLMALFSGDMNDLKHSREACSINATTQAERQYACLGLSHGSSFKCKNNVLFCFNRKQVFIQDDNPYAYKRYGISSTNCNQTSWIAWFLLIEYFFLSKRFLTSLLTAMFGLTGARVQNQSQQIWLHNRYKILLEYITRRSLPPPFVIISYIVTTNDDSDFDTNKFKDMSSKTIQHRSLCERLLSCKPCLSVIKENENKINENKTNEENIDKNVYWQRKATEFYAKKQEVDKVQDKLDSLSNITTNMQKNIDGLRKSLRNITNRVVTSEKLLIDSQILLEKIHTIIIQEDRSLPIYQKFIHTLSRESPYIYTNEARFPITEKQIPWKVSLDSYDPTMISLSKECDCFQDSERPFVEPDLTIESAVITVSDDTTRLSDYKWNQVVESQLPNGTKIIIDRTTWIETSEDQTPSVYLLDNQLSVPLNPMGRTGVGGHGALIRWGPNKSIIAVITRWKKHRDQYVVNNGQRVLETLVFKDKYTNDWKLSAANILGVESRYGSICRRFHELAFQNNFNFEYISSFQESDMIEHFKSFTHVSTDTFESTEFESHMVYRGYIDDLRNTDNAWIEAEIWNFHYNSDIIFLNLRQDGMAIWKDVTNSSRDFLMQKSILREISRIHHAFFE
ncbi:unnamed protein product [Rotaria sp. Silwood2]|nr:unnamed protein product [Rotaria sp. Silwood2]